ncbi:MAG: extracellular solute-binding protein, partial [Microbacterium sp.]|nr:extracellular solute-binding protein [Microbacterium sp.]
MATELVSAPVPPSRVIRDGSIAVSPLSIALDRHVDGVVYRGWPSAPAAADPDSKAAKTVRYSMFPKGPAGQFPGFATHAWGIPVGAKNKAASWEFIKWAMSKAMMMRAVTEKGYSSPSRRSVIESPEFKKRLTLNDNDVADIYLKTIDLAGESRYMDYRIVSVFPQVDTLIGQAMERI